ncbi:hypothetical protein DRP05_05560 [Archaeoglobales archaeon]|nr:MAG: hypothetical protein DRP05_05560 [Archaeoglobales archaeon]
MIEIYKKWGEKLGISKEILENIDALMAYESKEEVKIGNLTLDAIDEAYDLTNQILSKIIEECRKIVGEMNKNLMKELFLAINLYHLISAFYTNIERVAQHENIGDFINECINKAYDCYPLLYHPILRTTWIEMDSKLCYHYAEIIGELKEL